MFFGVMQLNFSSALISFFKLRNTYKEDLQTYYRRNETSSNRRQVVEPTSSSVLVLEWLWIGGLVDISFMEKTAVLPSGDQVHQVDNVSWWIGR